MKHPPAQDTGLAKTPVRFRLYVAGKLPNSRRAIANLRAFCLEYLPGAYEMEIVDVFEMPDRALQDRVLLTPHLLVETVQGVRRVTGDLSDRARLIDAIDTASLS